MRTIPMMGISAATEPCAVLCMSMAEKLTAGPPADKMGQFAWTVEHSSTMQRENLSDLLAFIAVARDRSFTRAAAKLGVSRSALSHTLRGLGAGAVRRAVVFGKGIGAEDRAGQHRSHVGQPAPAEP